MHGLKKTLLIIVGSMFVFLGVLGAILPLLPTTPFLLLAAACYVRSSERLYHKLINSKVLGAYIRNYREGKGMPMRAKIISLALLWASISLSFYRVDLTYVRIILTCVLLGVSLLILRIPTYQPQRFSDEH
jgi:uncharacterized membrane protein YbaN (DUF454 family)